MLSPLPQLPVLVGSTYGAVDPYPKVISGVTPSGGLAGLGCTEPVVASGVLTSNGTNVSNNDSVTIGGLTYTFKATLTDTTTAFEVLRAANADASLANLASAVSGAGTPGTDYGSLTPTHPSGRFGAISAHAMTFTALTPGAWGNTIATTKSAATLTWSGTTLASGANALLVNGPIGYSGTPSGFSSGTATATVFTLAAGERGFIQNLDDAALHVKYGSGCSTSSFSFILQAGSAASDGLGGIAADIDFVGPVSVCPSSGTALYVAWKQAL